MKNKYNEKRGNIGFNCHILDFGPSQERSLYNNRPISTIIYRMK